MSAILLVFASGSGSSGGPLTASAGPTTSSGIRYSPGTAETGESVICSALGGTGPYTYSWTLVSGDADVLPVNPSSSITPFYKYFESFGFGSAVYKCVVTDSAATVVDSNTVFVNLQCGPA